MTFSIAAIIVLDYKIAIAGGARGVLLDANTVIILADFKVLNMYSHRMYTIRNY